jgi:predicted nucleic acid-binding protein
MPDPSPVTIANTSPLLYLHQCGLTDLLVKLYDEILVPPAVVQELAAGRALGFDLPDLTVFPWVRIVRPQSMAILPAVSDLGPGEREALALAAETPGSILVIDDGLARRYAGHLGVRFTGTAGVLVKAKQRGLLAAVAPVLDRLAALRFRLDAQTRSAVLRLVGEELP